MATNPEYVEFVAERLAFAGNIRYKKMFGEYMIYVNDKPLVLVCDSVVFVKILPCLDELMGVAERGCPYEGAKEHYVLDIEDAELTGRVIAALDKVTPVPKPKPKMNADPNERVRKMKVSDVYPMLVRKAERKGRTKTEVDTVTMWLTGYDEAGFQSQLDNGASYERFFAEAPQINPNAHKITGVICGHRVEEIPDPLTQNVRRLDKLVDELAKGKAMEKILRG